MRVRSLIFLVNLLFALAGCATDAPPRQTLAAPAAVSAASSPATAPPAVLSRTDNYLTPASLNLYRLLPPPPEAGSARERAELDELLKIQAARSPAAAQRALDDATVSIFRFADALGFPPAFTPQRLPLTTLLFERIGRAESLFINSTKDAFGRPRPFLSEPRLAPVAPKLPSASYPSGHTTWAVACAIVLSDMLPERRAQIFARADEYSYNREVGGVHYPSDITAGHLAGTALATELLHSGSFLDDERLAAAELRQALGLPPLPRQRLYRH